jgi:hypothetical protein
MVFCSDVKRCAGPNGISNRLFLERGEVRVLTVPFCNSFNEIRGPWNAAN